MYIFTTTRRFFRNGASNDSSMSNIAASIVCLPTGGPSEFKDKQRQTRESVLECLRTVSQISRLLYSVESPFTHVEICLVDTNQCHNAHKSLEDQKYISREEKVRLVDLSDDDTGRLAASFQNQEDRENTSRTLQYLTESSEGNENNECITQNVPDITTVKASTTNHEEESILREDEISEGKRLFEDDRKSRLSSIADLKEILRKKQLKPKRGDSIHSNKADANDVAKLQSNHMQNGSNCGNREALYQNPEAQALSQKRTSRNVISHKSGLRTSSLESKTAREEDNLLRMHLSPQYPAPNNVRERNYLETQPKCELAEDESSRLPKIMREKEATFAASDKCDASGLLERKAYAKNVETGANGDHCSTNNAIKINRETPLHNQDVQDTIGVDQEGQRQTKPGVDKFKSRKHHSVERSERNDVDVTGNRTNIQEKQETPCPDYDDKATWKTFGLPAGEVLADGSMNIDTSRSQNNMVDLLKETHTGDGTNLEEDNGMHSMQKREPTKHSKSKATISNCKEITTTFMFQGGDVVADGEVHKNLGGDGSVLAQNSDKDNHVFLFIPNHGEEDAIGVDREGQRQTKLNVSTFKIKKRELEGRERSGLEIIRSKTNTSESQGTSCCDHNDMATERTSGPLGEEALSDGSMNRETARSQNDVVALLTETDFVNGPKLKEEIGTQSLNQGSRALKPISSYGQIYFKSQATTSNRHETSTRLLCQGSDVVADGESNEDDLNNVDIADGPALTQNPYKAFNAGERFTANMKHKSVPSCSENESHTDTDALCKHRYPLNSETDLFQSHSGDGGARPKQRSTDNAKCPLPWPGGTNPISADCDFKIENRGLDPVFMARHVKESSPFPSFYNGGNYNHASLDGPWQEDYEQEYSSSNAHDQVFKGKGQISPEKKKFIPHDIVHKSNMCVPVYNASVNKNFSFYHVTQPNGNEKESWHFPSSESWEDRVLRSQCFAERTNKSNRTSLPKSFDADREKLFNTCGSVCAYNDMDSMANEYFSSIAKDECAQSLPLSENEHSSTEHSLASSFRCLQDIMAKTIRLVVSNATGAGKTQPANQAVEKTGVQEETGDTGEGEPALTQQVNETNTQVESTPSNKTTIEAKRQPVATPVQESPRPVCSHYQRRCLVRFPCCGKFFPCHRCHNESDCSEDQARAINATHIRCTICYHEQEIDENGQRCGGCNAIMSEYFCPTCRHYTSVDKNPFHCEKCGICRIHRDRSFHCNVCNVCLDKRLEGKHKCRPDSGHDECCICLEDAFSGCQILPCSHKVHKDCAIAMIQNGVTQAVGIASGSLEISLLFSSEIILKQLLASGSVNIVE
ncbi:RING finger and CHY zinc finger domain-containing protein 1 [Stylophora pistillata]|uniref:RING finger and CHY zinc finger domain-containing protein 1 n=1 Tax=Stylophora pistillata TaxID=50429 RepID=A0A2B4RP31_STYPI|nr:RING finger and CHY zinc finger domain-containing protein 1 [Stylophora pistillata]